MIAYIISECEQKGDASSEREIAFDSTCVSHGWPIIVSQSRTYPTHTRRVFR